MCMYRSKTFNVGEGDFDAAEMDRDIISSRLKQDVAEHAGKVHLFIADNVSSHFMQSSDDMTDNTNSMTFHNSQVHFCKPEAIDSQ